MKIITSPKNEAIKAALKLKDKDYFWWEGLNFYNEIEKERKEVEILFIEEEIFRDRLNESINIKSKEIFIVSQRVFEKLSSTKSPQGIGGLIKRPSYNIENLIKEGGNIFYLAGLQDPGNVGAIIRIADAFGFSGIIYEKRGACPFNEKSVRSSTGSILRVPCLEGDIVSLCQLKESGFNIFFLTASSKVSKNIYEIKSNRKNVFVLGQEGKGIDIAFDYKEDIYIPIKEGVDSLNVSVTAGIVGFYINSLGAKVEKY